MANTNTITSANAVAILTEQNFFPAGVQLQGFAADAAFALESAQTAETVLGVDGIMSAGWVPRMYRQQWDLQADSDSIAVFDAIAGGQDVAQTVFFLGMVIQLPSLGKAWNFSRGVLTNYKAMPDGKRILQPQQFAITWNTVRPVIL
jgi:hypothetical protein